MWRIPSNKAHLLLIFFFATLILFILATCNNGGGGGSNKATNPSNITITGMVDDGSSNSPIPDGSCSFIDTAGQIQGTDICDSDGSFQLSIPPDTQGYIYCGPQSMPDLNLTTSSSTVGYASGETKPDENVTPTTTVVADIIRYENPSDPESRKAELILQADQDPNLAIVTQIAGRLYRAMLAQNVNARFGDDHSNGRSGNDGGGGGGGGGDGGSNSGGGVSGAAGDGADFSPLIEAQCAFVIGDEFESTEEIYPAALADYLKDGELDRPDLAALSATVSEGLPQSAEEIQQAFSAWFPDGLGDELVTTTDAEGYYFLPVPANLPGFVRCTPKDRQNLVLGTYVPGRTADTDLAGQDIDPATTIFSAVVASELKEDLGAVKQNYLGNIEDLELLLDWPDYPEGQLNGFDIVTGPTTNSEVGLVAFSATALFNALYKNDLDVDYLAAIAHLVERAATDPDNPIDPTFLEAQGISATQAQQLADMVNTSVNNAGDELGTNLAAAFSTARINVTVKETPDSENGIPGAQVTVETKKVFCDEGCGQQTDASGQLTLTLSGVSTETATPIPVRVASVAGYDEVTVTAEVVAFATVDLEIILGTTNNLTIEGGGNGSGGVTSTPVGINCDLDGATESGTCGASFAEGDQVTLTATPEAGSAFGGWGGACSGAETTCTVTMDADVTLTASFASQCSEEDVHIGSDGDSFGANGGEGSLTVTAPDGCPWSVTTTAPAWITIDSGGSGSGNGTVRYTVAANETTDTKIGTITVGQRTHTVTQGPLNCTISISPEERDFQRTDGSGSITVTVPEGCPWTASTTDDWLSIVSGGSGNGNGTVNYAVAANTDSPQRDGTIVVGGVAHTVHQEEALIPPTPDPMTWATEPHETSTTAIAMTATTATDPDTPVSYQFDFVDSTTGGTGGTDSGWQSGTTYTDSGLGTNHRYGYRVRARDGDDNRTDWSSTRYAYTAANTPGAGEFSNAAATSIQAHWTANGNPSGTEYYCENTTAGTNSGWITAISWNSTGLTCGESYSFRVRARNGDNDVTGWRNLGSGQTADCPDTTAPTPNPMTWATEPHETSTSAIAMTASTATDPTTPITYQFDFVDSTTGGTGGTDSGWQSGTTYTDSGLGTNHRYGYRVRARDGAGNPTAYSSTSYDYTDIETPSGITFGTITTTSIQARSTNTPSGLSRGGSGLIIYNMNQETDSTWRQNNNLWTSGSLAINQSYGFRAQARNGDGNATAQSDTQYRYTLANTPGYSQFSSITQTSIRANWTANNNPTGTQYRCQNTTTNEYSAWTTNTYWVDLGLTCGSAYAFRVQARNGDNTVTDWTSLGSASTLACLPVVTVSVVDSSAAEAEEFPDHGIYRISRTGSTSSSLAVYISMSGTATNGKDFQTITSPVYIAAGSSYTDVNLTVLNDYVDELDETARLTILLRNGYTPGTPSYADITILDDDEADGLVAYYPFNGNADDESGQENHGTVEGAELTTDRDAYKNRAYSFDGINDRITTSQKHFAADNNLSVSLWVRISGTKTTRYLVMCSDFGVTEKDNKIGLAIWLEGGTNSARVTIADGGWHHFVGTYDGTTISAYLDGKQVETINWPGNISDPDRVLTFGYDGNYYYWQGHLDDIRIYNRVITQSEIQQLYQE